MKSLEKKYADWLRATFKKEGAVIGTLERCWLLGIADVLDPKKKAKPRPGARKEG